MTGVVRITDALADLVLGARCAGCGVAALGLCPDCTTALAGLRPRRAFRPLPGFPATVSAGEYAGRLRRVVLVTKERGGLSHLPLLGRLLARAVASLVLAGDPVTPLVLVPVPTVRARVLERGLDLTAVLAQRAARELHGYGLPVVAAGVVRLAQAPADQVGLGRQDRVANLRGAYRCGGRVPSGSVVVVDDVVTTGATLSAVADTLRSAGVYPYGAATLADTPRRGGPRAPASGIG